MPAAPETRATSNTDTTTWTREAKPKTSGRLKLTLDELHRTIAASASGAGALGRVAGQLAGTGRVLKSQNAVRLQALAGADALRRQVTQLRERVDHLLPDNGPYRWALASQRGNPPLARQARWAAA